LLDAIKTALEGLSNEDASPALDHIGTVMQQGMKVVQELDGLINTRLSHGEDSNRAVAVRCRGWLRQSRLEKIRLALVDVRHKLVAALSAIHTMQL